MTFGHPQRLWLIALAVILLGAYLLAQRMRPRYVVRFTTLELLETVAPRHPGWRHHAMPLGMLAALTTLLVAFADPAMTVQDERATATVILAMDVSPSMLAQDVAPSRMEAARTAASAFVELLPESFTVGLVSFAGTAQVLIPPTHEHHRVLQGLRGLDHRSETAIGEAIFASMEAIDLTRAAQDDQELAPATVLLLSDGAQTTGRTVEAAVAAARQRNVTISAIAFGTPEGTVELGGEVVDVPPDVPTVEAVAQRTSGTAFVAQTAPELTRVYDEIATEITTAPVERPLSEPLVAAAIALLAATAALSLVWLRILP